MLVRRFNLFLGLGLGAIFCTDSAFGQGFSGGGFSDYLLRRDENQNGLLDPEEWQNSRSRFMIENAAKEAGIDLTRPIPIQQLQAAMTAQREKMGGGSPFGGGFGGSSSGGFGGSGGGYGGYGGRGDWGRSSESSNGSWGRSSESSNRDGSSSSSENRRSESRREEKKPSLPPGVPGFGEKVDLKPVLGFGSALESNLALASAAPVTKEEEKSKEKERERSKESRDQPREERRDERPSWGSRDSGSRESGSSARDKEDYERREREKNRETAKSMVAQNDTNKDGVLAKRDDEWKNLRGTPENADYNKDGIITVDELTERLMERSRESYASSSRGGSYGGYGSKPAVGTNGKPVRFLTATERLPEGLPTWFTRGDLNGDGQVSMGEYATKWDDAKISEFMKYDLNADGMITAAECIAVEKSRGGSSSTRTASTYGPPSAGGLPSSEKAAVPSEEPAKKTENSAADPDMPVEETMPAETASE